MRIKITALLLFLLTAALNAQTLRDNVSIYVNHEDGPRTSDAEFFEALNLDYPGLEAVKADVAAGDLEAAKTDFVKYLKARTNVKWFFDWRTFGTPQAKKQRYDKNNVEEFAKNHLVSCNVWHQFGERVDWSANPTELKYREWTWQLSRHPFWEELGRAYWATGDEKYAAAFVNQLRSWVEDNPVPLKCANVPGSRWRTIESGIRTCGSWPNAFFYFLPSPSFDDYSIILMVKSFYEHAKYLKAYPSINNWLTMEMDGLFHIGTVFPEFKEAREWQDFASARLYREEQVQFYPDGAQKELAPGYHFVSVNNIIKVYRIARINGYQLPGDFVERLQAAYEYSQKIMAPSGYMPGVNDSSFEDARHYLKTASAVFPGRKDFQYGATAGKKGVEPSYKSLWMPWAGWYVMRSGWNAEEDIYAFFEVGPYSEGHSHEDKLSFIVEAYGDRVVTEGGTYAYDTSQWRKYILSARAHNVSRVDGLDQSRGTIDRKADPSIRTNFAPMANRFVNTDGYVFGEGWYTEGFGSRNDRTVSQYRAMVMVNSRYWILLDVFTPSDDKEHTYESFFHFNTPEYNVMKKFVGVESTCPEKANVAIVRLDSKAKGLKVMCGQETPEVQGWIPAGKRVNVYYCLPVATPTFSRKGVGEVVDPYIIIPVRKGATAGLRKIRAAGHNKYVISFTDGRTDRIAFSLENGALKTFSINGKNML